MMTPEETFQAAVRHLHGQGWKRSTTPGDRSEVVCLYRGPEGRKCVAGAFIPDERYLKEFEGRGVTRVIQTHGKDVFGNAHIGTLERLQPMYDKGYNPRLMRVHFVRAAEDNAWPWPEDVPQEGPIE